MQVEQLKRKLIIELKTDNVFWTIWFYVVLRPCLWRPYGVNKNPPLTQSKTLNTFRNTHAVVFINIKTY